jgi:hypothetical protein
MEEPKNDKIWVTVDHTVNLGNYENLKISSGMSLTYIEDEDPQILRKNITDQLIREVLVKGKQIKKKRYGNL